MWCCHVLNVGDELLPVPETSCSWNFLFPVEEGDEQESEESGEEEGEEEGTESDLVRPTKTLLLNLTTSKY